MVDWWYFHLLILCVICQAYYFIRRSSNEADMHFGQIGMTSTRSHFLEYSNTDRMDCTKLHVACIPCTSWRCVEGPVDQMRYILIVLRRHDPHIQCRSRAPLRVQDINSQLNKKNGVVWRRTPMSYELNASVTLPLIAETDSASWPCSSAELRKHYHSASVTVTAVRIAARTQMFLLTYLLAYLLAYLLTYLLTYLPTYFLTYLLACLLTYLLAYLLTYLFAYLLTYLLTYLRTYLLACLLNDLMSSDIFILNV